MPELIVLVDDDGQPIGTAEKLPSHHADTPLHLAFSCYVFDDQGKLLVTRRALGKKVWPGVWTNSACGHPGPGEAMEAAIRRRLKDELGMTVSDIQIVLPRYRYKTPPFKGIIENEFCPVYVARATSQPVPNPDEVADYKWLRWPDFMTALAGTAGEWSWWCKDQLKQLRDKAVVAKYAQAKRT